MDTGQGCCKSFKAETSNRMNQMAPNVLQGSAYFNHFNAIKYKRPHSKTLEASLTGGNSNPFQESKVLQYFLLTGFEQRAGNPIIRAPFALVL